MTTLLVVLLIGATIRLTRLLTADAIFEVPRGWVEQRLPSSVAYLIRCDWCLSVWVGFITFAFGRYAPETLVLIVSGALTASLFTGWSTLISTAVEVTVWSDDDDAG